MNPILIKNAVLINPQSTWHNQKVNIGVSQGKVKEITTSELVVEEGALVLDAKGNYIARGFVDMLGYCSEPGEEWKEDFDSYSKAASAGGFTHAAVLSGTNPLPYSATAIKQVDLYRSTAATRLLPLGLPTLKGEGKEMSEMYDMVQSGAIGFFNGDQPIEDLGLLQRILEYLSTSSAVLYFYPHLQSLAIGGIMHEGQVHVKLGLKGMPVIAETTALNAAIAVAKWLNCKLHITRISTAEAARIAKEHHSENITFSVPVMNLMFNDDALMSFDENYKVLPPLREEADRKALLEGLKNRSIAAVISNHQPQDIEAKQVEFEYAAFGASTLQHTFNLLCTALGAEANPAFIEEVLSASPRKILGLDHGPIALGMEADFTVFSMDEKTRVSKQVNKSRGINDAFIGKELSGRIVATVLGNNIEIAGLSPSY